MYKPPNGMKIVQCLGDCQISRCRAVICIVILLNFLTGSVSFAALRLLRSFVIGILLFNIAESTET